MRFTAFAIVALSTICPSTFALPSAPVAAVPMPVSVDPSNVLTKRAVTSCVAGAPNYGHAAQLMDCVKWFRDNPNPGFGAWNCAGKTFRIGGNSWQSSKDCVTGCVDCLLGIAGQGRHTGKCDQQAGFANCWFIYCNEGTSC